MLQNKELERVALRFMLDDPKCGLFKESDFHDKEQEVFREIIKHNRPINKDELNALIDDCPDYHSLKLVDNVERVIEELKKVGLFNTLEKHPDIFKQGFISFNGKPSSTFKENGLNETLQLVADYNQKVNDSVTGIIDKFQLHDIDFCDPCELPNAHEKREWLIDGVLMKNTFNELIAPQKAGKTQLSYQLAASVQNGVPFLGHDTLQRDVLYVDWEMDQSEIYERTEKLKEFINIPDYKQFKVLSLRQKNSLSIEAVIAKIRKAKEKNDNINLVFFDNFYSLTVQFDGFDTNNAEDVARLLTQIRDDLGEDITFVLVNHTNKSVSVNEKETPTFNMILSAAFGSVAHGRFVDDVIYLHVNGGAKTIMGAGRHISPEYSIPVVQSAETNWFFATCEVMKGKLTQEDFDIIDNYLSSGGNGRILSDPKKDWSNFRRNYPQKNYPLYKREILEAAGYRFELGGKNGKTVYVYPRQSKGFGEQR